MNIRWSNKSSFLEHSFGTVLNDRGTSRKGSKFNGQKITKKATLLYSLQVEKSLREQESWRIWEGREEQKVDGEEGEKVGKERI